MAVRNDPAVTGTPAPVRTIGDFAKGLLGGLNDPDPEVQKEVTRQALPFLTMLSGMPRGQGEVPDVTAPDVANWASETRRSLMNHVMQRTGAIDEMKAKLAESVGKGAEYARAHAGQGNPFDVDSDEMLAALEYFDGKDFQRMNDGGELAGDVTTKKGFFGGTGGKFFIPPEIADRPLFEGQGLALRRAEILSSPVKTDADGARFVETSSGPVPLKDLEHFEKNKDSIRRAMAGIDPDSWLAGGVTQGSLIDSAQKALLRGTLPEGLGAGFMWDVTTAWPGIKLPYLPDLYGDGDKHRSWSALQDPGKLRAFLEVVDGMRKNGELHPTVGEKAAGASVGLLEFTALTLSVEGAIGAGVSKAFPAIRAGEAVAAPGSVAARLPVVARGVETGRKALGVSGYGAKGYRYGLQFGLRNTVEEINYELFRSAAAGDNTVGGAIMSGTAQGVLEGGLSALVRGPGRWGIKALGQASGWGVNKTLKSLDIPELHPWRAIAEASENAGGSNWIWKQINNLPSKRIDLQDAVARLAGRGLLARHIYHTYDAAVTGGAFGAWEAAHADIPPEEWATLSLAEKAGEVGRRFLTTPESWGNVAAYTAASQLYFGAQMRGVDPRYMLSKLSPEARAQYDALSRSVLERYTRPDNLEEFVGFTKAFEELASKNPELAAGLHVRAPVERTSGEEYASYAAQPTRPTSSVLSEERQKWIDANWVPVRVDKWDEKAPAFRDSDWQDSAATLYRPTGKVRKKAPRYLVKRTVDGKFVVVHADNPAQQVERTHVWDSLYGAATQVSAILRSKGEKSFRFFPGRTQPDLIPPEPDQPGQLPLPESPNEDVPRETPPKGMPAPEGNPPPTPEDVPPLPRPRDEGSPQSPQGRAPAPPEEPRQDTPEDPQLPRDLRGAKPRYSYKSENFELEFASDVDKALFITSQKAKSKRDADYRKWLADQGFSEADIDAGGAEVRAQIKEQASKSFASSGPLKIGAARSQARVDPEAPPAERPPQIELEREAVARAIVALGMKGEAGKSMRRRVAAAKTSDELVALLDEIEAAGAPKAPEAPPAQPEPVPEPEEVEPERPAPSTPVGENGVGRRATLELPSGDSIPVTYRIVEASDLVPSHDARKSFRINPKGDVNERPYHDPTEGRAERQKVLAQAANPKPSFLHSDTPSATDGPPIVTDRDGDLVVLGGNGRAMAVQLAYENGRKETAGAARAAALREATVQAAARFGIDPKQIEGMREPVLVREMSAADAGEPGELSRILNASFTQAKGQLAEAVSRGRKLTPEAARAISEVVGDGTLREALNEPGSTKKILNALADAGVITKDELVGIMDSERGILTATGKDVVEFALLGAAVGDVRTLAEASPSTKAILLKALPQILASKQAFPPFSEVLTHALEGLKSMRDSRTKGLDEAIRSTTMFDEPWKTDEAAVRLMDSILHETPTKFAKRMNDVAAALGNATSGQGDMFGAGPGVPAAEVLVDRLKGTGSDFRGMPGITAEPFFKLNSGRAPKTEADLTANQVAAFHGHEAVSEMMKAGLISGDDAPHGEKVQTLLEAAVAEKPELEDAFKKSVGVTFKTLNDAMASYGNLVRSARAQRAAVRKMAGGLAPDTQTAAALDSYFRAIDEASSPQGMSDKTRAEIKALGWLDPATGTINKSVPGMLGEWFAAATRDFYSKSGQPPVFMYSIDPMAIFGNKVGRVNMNANPILASNAGRAVIRKLLRHNALPKTFQAMLVAWQRGIRISGNRTLPGLGRLWQGLGLTDQAARLNFKFMSNVLGPADAARMRGWNDLAVVVAKLRAPWGDHNPPAHLARAFVEMIDSGAFKAMKGPQDVITFTGDPNSGYLWDVMVAHTEVFRDIAHEMRRLGLLNDAQLQKYDRQYILRGYLRMEGDELYNALQRGEYSAYLPGRTMSRGTPDRQAAAVRIQQPDVLILRGGGQELAMNRLVGILDSMLDQGVAVPHFEFERKDANGNPLYLDFDRAQFSEAARSVPETGKVPVPDTDRVEWAKDRVNGTRLRVEQTKLGLILRDWRRAIRDGEVAETPQFKRILDAYLPADGSPGVALTHNVAQHVGLAVDAMFDHPADKGASLEYMSSVVNEIQGYWRRAVTIGQPSHWILSRISDLANNHVMSHVSIGDFVKSTISGKGHYADAIRHAFWWESWARAGKPRGTRPDVIPQELVDKGWTREMWEGAQQFDAVADVISGGTFNEALLSTTATSDLFGRSIDVADYSVQVEMDIKAKHGQVGETTAKLGAALKLAASRMADGHAKRDMVVGKLMGSTDPSARVRALTEWTAQYQVYELMGKYAGTLGVQANAQGPLSLREAAAIAAAGLGDYRAANPELRRWTTQFNLYPSKLTSQAMRATGSNPALEAIPRLAFAGPFWLYDHVTMAPHLAALRNVPQVLSILALTQIVRMALTSSDNEEEHVRYLRDIAGSINTPGQAFLSPDQAEMVMREGIPIPLVSTDHSTPAAVRELARRAWINLMTLPPDQFQSPNRFLETRTSNLGDLTGPARLPIAAYSTLTNPPSSSPAEAADAAVRRLYGQQTMSALALFMASKRVLSQSGTREGVLEGTGAGAVQLAKEIAGMAQMFSSFIDPETWIMSKQAVHASEMALLKQPIDQWARGMIPPPAQTPEEAAWEVVASTMWRNQAVRQQNAMRNERTFIQSVVNETLGQPVDMDTPAGALKARAAKLVTDQWLTTFGGTYKRWLDFQKDVPLDTFDRMLGAQMLVKDLDGEAAMRGEMALIPKDKLQTDLGRVIAAQPPDLQRAALEYAQRFFRGTAWEGRGRQVIYEAARSRAVSPSLLQHLYRGALGDGQGRGMMHYMHEVLVERGDVSKANELYPFMAYVQKPLQGDPDLVKYEQLWGAFEPTARGAPGKVGRIEDVLPRGAFGSRDLTPMKTGGSFAIQEWLRQQPNAGERR